MAKYASSTEASEARLGKKYYNIKKTRRGNSTNKKKKKKGSRSKEEVEREKGKIHKHLHDEQEEEQEEEEEVEEVQKDVAEKEQKNDSDEDAMEIDDREDDNNNDRKATEVQPLQVEDPKDMSNFLSKMTHYIVEASWLNDLDEAGKLKIKDSLDRLAILIKNMHARSKTKELMDVITEITEEKSSVKKFIDDAKKDGVTFFCSYIPTFMYPKDVEDDEDIEEEDIVGLICINIIPIENLKSRATVQPSDLIIEPRWVGIKKVTS